MPAGRSPSGVDGRCGPSRRREQPSSQLAPPCRVACQEQAGNVRAGNQQHAGHDRQEQIERLRVAASQPNRVPDRPDSRPRAGSCTGSGREELGRQCLVKQRFRFHLDARGRTTSACTRPITRKAQSFGLLSTSRPRSMTGINGTTGASMSTGHPVEPEGTRRRDADDHRGRAVDRDGLTDGTRIAPK